MIGKRIALEVVPNQALFSLDAAAQYLGINRKTLAEDADAGKLKCYDYHGRRTFKLEDLETLRASLAEWDNRAAKRPPQRTSTNGDR